MTLPKGVVSLSLVAKNQLYIEYLDEKHPTGTGVDCVDLDQRIGNHEGCFDLGGFYFSLSARDVKVVGHLLHAKLSTSVRPHFQLKTPHLFRADIADENHRVKLGGTIVSSSGSQFPRFPTNCQSRQSPSIAATTCVSAAARICDSSTSSSWCVTPPRTAGATERSFSI